MVPVTEYPDIVKRVIDEYAAFPPSHGEVEVETVYDEGKGHYELLHVGWNGWHRIHGSVIHVDVKEGMIWIQHDGTEEGIAEDLVQAGVPRDRIVLGFRHPFKRPHTGFAIG